jgi:defect-in-organelle-trafficking protein DotD
LLLAGCATVVPVPTTVEMPGMPNPEAALQQSIHHVDAEMAELGEMSPTMTRVAEPIVPEELQRTVSFSWNGPLDAGVAKLAASIGYTFYTSGPATQKPLPSTRSFRRWARKPARRRPCKSIHNTTRSR